MRHPKKVERKGGTSYQIRYVDQNRKTRYETFRSKHAAERRLREIETQRDDGTMISEMKFSALAPEWLRAHCDEALRASSILDLQYAVARLVRCLGTRHLRDITPAVIENFRAQELEAIRASLRERLAQRKRPPEDMARAVERAANGGVRSVNKAIATLKAILKFAIGRRYISYNAAEHVKKPKIPRSTALRQTEDIYTPSELQAVIDATHPDWRAAVMLLGIGGLRLGEMLGMTWPCVEFASNRVYVRQQLEAATGNLSATKTAKGVRYVELPAFVMLELKRWRLRCPASEMELCFPTKAGTLARADNFRPRVLDPAERRAGLRRITPHGLRHGAASMLIASGADIASVSRQLGHANVATTLAIYTHAFEKRAEPGLGAKMAALMKQEGCENGYAGTSAA